VRDRSGQIDGRQNRLDIVQARSELGPELRRDDLGQRNKEHHGQLAFTESRERENGRWGSEGNLLGHIQRGGQIDGRQNQLDVVRARSELGPEL
jgi:hypothetical protein